MRRARLRACVGAGTGADADADAADGLSPKTGGSTEANALEAIRADITKKRKRS